MRYSPAMLLRCSAALALLCSGALSAQYTATVKTTTTSSTTSPWRVWKSSTCTMNFPGRWRSDENAVPGTVVAFMAPADSLSGHQAHVDIRFEEVKEMTLADYAHKAEGEASERAKDVHLLGSLEEEGTGRYGLEFTGTLNGVPMHFLQEVMVHGGKAWTLTYAAPADQYDDLLVTAQAMFGSFKLL